MRKTFHSLTIGAAAAALALAVSAGGSVAADNYVGKYKTEDTQGNPMQITLSADGTAAGTRGEESLTGTWKEDAEGDAVITWGDGWITSLSKEGDSYTKTGYEEGKTEQAQETTAEKVE